MDMEQYDAFRRQIADNPYDQAIRLVFADFLEENDRNEEAMLHRAWTPEKQKKAETVIDQIIEYNKLATNRQDVLDKIYRSWENNASLYITFWGMEEQAPTADDVVDAYSILTGEPIPDHDTRRHYQTKTCPC